MTTSVCGPCQRVLEPEEMEHLHMTRLYDAESTTFWSQFPTIRMATLFERWLRETQQIQLINDALPFLPPAVHDHERLVHATNALRVALKLPHVRSLLELLEVVLERMAEDVTR